MKKFFSFKKKFLVIVKSKVIIMRNIHFYLNVAETGFHAPSSTPNQCWLFYFTGFHLALWLLELNGYYYNDSLFEPFNTVGKNEIQRSGKI